MNPNAGSVEDAIIPDIEAALKRLGDVSVLTTERAGEAKELAAKAIADGCEVIVAAGGDGAVNEVVNGIAPNFSRVQLGILPLGTANDLARSIAIPNDIEAALDIIAAGHIQELDVVRAISNETRYFINVSALGFSGEVSLNLTEEVKASWGSLAYIRSGLTTIPNLTEYHISIRFDDGEDRKMDVYNIILANARYVGGGIPVAPQALLNDGLVDVIIVPVMKMTQLALLAPRILLGEHMDSDLLICRRARKVVIRSEPGLWFNLDGELMGNEPVTFEVLPHALRVITGQEAQGV
jgi:diacylglycerol kinase (ATP)